MNNQNTQTIPKQEGQALAAIPYKKSAFSLIMTVLTWAAAVLSVAVLVFLVVFVLAKGVGSITPDLFSLEYSTENASVIPAIVNTLEMTVIALVIAVPIGICAAIFLVEYTNNTGKVVGIIRITAETLSGIPSIVYGLFGMLFFTIALGLGYSMVSGALTLAIMVLPLIMRTSEEALKSVPVSYREASFGLEPASCGPFLRSYCPPPCRGSSPGSSWLQAGSWERRRPFCIPPDLWPSTRPPWLPEEPWRSICTCFPPRGSTWTRPLPQP